VKHLFFQVPKAEDPPQVAGNAKFSPYFNNCIGALDGTHIGAIVPTEDQAVFRNRKKSLSQNVLGVCNFDLTKTYFRETLQNLKPSFICPVWMGRFCARQSCSG
jgi:hypothetical protein